MWLIVAKSHQNINGKGASNMHLFCQNCGQPYTSGNFCANCSAPLIPINQVMPMYQQPYMPPTPPSNPYGLSCKRCGGANINISINTIQAKTKGKADLRKRSLAERSANKVGRGMANMMTMGMYGVFAPKKGKYKEYQSSNTSMIQQKIAVCQNCGNSWNVR